MELARWIFSNERKHRLVRHLAFWMVYASLFFFQSLVPRSPDDFLHVGMYMIAATSTLCFLPSCMISVYLAVYWVWPSLLRSKRYGHAFLAFILIFAADISINYYFSGVFHESRYVKASGIGFSGQLGLAYLNAVWAITAMGLGLAIKISRVCYIQKKENLEISKRSMRTQLDVEKAKLRPAYLYSSLNTIQNKTDAGYDDPGQMILKLSDVLSYTLYQSESDLVPLHTELAAVIDFIDLERMKQNGLEQVALEWDTPEDLMVPPTLILSFLQEVVTQSYECMDRDWHINVAVRGSYEKLQISISGNYGYLCPDLSVASVKMRHRLETVYEGGTFQHLFRQSGSDFSIFVTLLETAIYQGNKKALSV
jgi:hypothetical protein